MSSDLRFALLYNGPVLGLGLIWVVLRIRESGRWSTSRKILDGLLTALAASRFMGAPIPPSGHALFLTYSLLTTSNRLYRLATLAMLIVTVGLKVSWRDYTSWVFGILIGAGAGAVWIYTLNNASKTPAHAVEGGDSPAADRS